MTKLSGDHAACGIAEVVDPRRLSEYDAGLRNQYSTDIGWYNGRAAAIEQELAERRFELA